MHGSRQARRLQRGDRALLRDPGAAERDGFHLGDAEKPDTNNDDGDQHLDKRKACAVRANALTSHVHTPVPYLSLSTWPLIEDFMQRVHWLLVGVACSFQV